MAPIKGVEAVDYASLVLGIAVGSVALGLESHRRLSKWRTKDPTELDVRYANRRQVLRRWTNGLFGLIGLLATLAGCVGRGPVWIGLWAAVPLVLVGTVGLACWDFVETDRYLQKKLPEIRRQTLKDTDPTPQKRS